MRTSAIDNRMVDVSDRGLEEAMDAETRDLALQVGADRTREGTASPAEATRNTCPFSFGIFIALDIACSLATSCSYWAGENCCN
jgi:hypothetical protein